MLMRTDPFRELDRLTQQVFDAATRTAPWFSTYSAPMDAYREGDKFVVHIDLPGVDADSIDLELEQNVLTVRAERRDEGGDDRDVLVQERPTGQVTRRLFLADTLDTDSIEAHYDAGVLTLVVPVAEQAKPRRIAISNGGRTQKQLAA